MANIRRPGSLTTVLNNVKNKIEVLEARGTTTGGAVSSITPSGNADAGGAPAITADSPRYLYKRVLKAYIYGSKVTGGRGSRIELYFGEDPDIAKGEYVQIQGINGTSTDTWEEMSPAKYLVLDVDTPPWTDGTRATQDWRDTPTTGNNGDTITHTVWFNPDLEIPLTYPTTSGRELITTRRIDSVSATGSTVTINFNSTHIFQENDVISVDLEGSLYGIDGLFKVSNVVDNNTIEYELDAPLPTPISLSGSELGTKYVYPVAHVYVDEGTIWTDTSVTPNKVYVWKEYRWYDTSDPAVAGAVSQDGVLPSPVTSLTATSELPAGATSPVINLSWTAPTTKTDGSSLSGFLSGYDIWYKLSSDLVWKKETIKDGGAGVTTHQIKDSTLLQNFTYNIRVYTVDILSQYSTAATVDVSSAKYSEVLNPPSTPTTSSKLGTITVKWDGKDSTGNLPVPGVIFIEFHESTTSGFTPSSSTLIETLPITNSGMQIVRTGLTFNGTTNYYYKTKFIRQISPTETEKSDPSTQSAGQLVVGVTGPDIVAGSVTTNNLEAGFVTAEIVRGNQIQTALSGARVVLNQYGIYAYNGASTNPVFAFNTSTSTLTISGYAQSSDIPDTSGFITADQVNSNVTSISGNSIKTGTITGITVQSTLGSKSVVLANGRISFSDGSATGYIEGAATTPTTGMVLQSSDTIYVNAPNGITGDYASFAEMSSGVRLTVDSIRRQFNGQLTFTTGGNTTVAYIDTSLTGSSDVSLWVIGRVSGATSYVTRSSRRFKTNIQPYSDPFDSLLNLNVVTYQVDQAASTAISEEDEIPPLGPIEVGLIAEEVAEAGLETIVAFNKENPSLVEGIDYGRVGVLLIPIVKKLKEEINDLKTRLDSM